MNEEQRNKLAIMLNVLTNAQHDVSISALCDNAERIDRRERLIDEIIDFVESLTAESDDDPLFGALIYDGPRAGLRRCECRDGRRGFYHRADALEALVEFEDGTLEWVDLPIQLVDVGAKDWRDMQPELDRAREVISQAERDYEAGKKNNTYKRGSKDWDDYELGWFSSEAEAKE